jgi:hypothetical protein
VQTPTLPDSHGTGPIDVLLQRLTEPLKHIPLSDAEQEALAQVAMWAPIPAVHTLSCVLVRAIGAARAGLDIADHDATAIALTNPAEITVWAAAARRGIAVHNVAHIPRELFAGTSCGRSTRTGLVVTAEYAAEQWAPVEWCRTCWPSGSPLGVPDGQHRADDATAPADATVIMERVAQ